MSEPRSALAALRTMPTLRRALLAALVAVPSAFSVSGAAECTPATRPDGWSVVRPAAFAVGGPVLTGFAMAGRQPDSMVVTNGAAVQVTTDGGCTWRPAALPGGDLAVLDGERAVLELEVVSPRAGAPTLWVLARSGGPVERPLVYRSDDLGVTFAGPGLGLPPGVPRVIAPAADGQTAYVVVDVPTLGRRLYVTPDGGETWNAAAATEEIAYDDLVVDTVRPEHVFAWTASALAESNDSGATFRPVDVPAGLIRDVALSQAPRGSRLALLGENGALLRSDNDGKDWSRLRVDPRADQVAAAPDVDVAAVAGDRVVTLLPSVFRPVDASPLGAEPLDLALGRVGGTRVRLAGRVNEAVLVYAGAVLDLGDDVTADIDLRGAQVVVSVGPRLEPGRVEVTLAPGETRDVDYYLQVPAAPSPIEVFFLIDTTGSMGFVIDGIRQGLAKIVNDLGTAGIAARFGVGEVKEYPISPYSSDPDLPYRLVREVGPVDAELESALAELQASGGGDGPESMPTGYYQLATGAGDTVDGEVMVPRGHDAGFGAGAMRIVVASTDVQYHGGAGYPGPPTEKAHAALVAEGINVIGIAAAQGARGDLSRTAEATGTFAPRHGVDCDLDGTPDVDESEPLVCEITGGAAVNIGGDGISVDTSGAKGVGSAIITLLRGLRDPASLTLRSSAPDVARVLGEATIPVDLKTPNEAAYRVRLSCPPARYGTTTRATLDGLAGGRRLASGAVAVQCQAPARRPPVVEPVEPPQPKPPVAAAAVPPAPVQPVHQVNPNGNPQTNPNPNAQLQAGAAQQRQEQFQLALAHDGALDPTLDHEELAMVRRDPPAVAVPAAAALMAMAVGSAAALRRRNATAPALARRRSC